MDVNRMMYYLRRVLKSRDMNNKKSVLLLNIGLHLIRATSLEKARNVIDAYVTEIQRHDVNVIWRGQTAVGEKTARKLFKRSFQSNQVCNIIHFISLFSLYTRNLIMHNFCKYVRLDNSAHKYLHFSIKQ